MHPAALQHLSLFETGGPLNDANRGVVEFNDLLKRPIEAWKYLLVATEQAQASLDHVSVFLDVVMIASSNELHLDHFKQHPDWPSFLASHAPARLFAFSSHGAESYTRIAFRDDDALVFGGDLGQAYLGTQGDIWDAQKDMLMCGTGAFIADADYEQAGAKLGSAAEAWAADLVVKFHKPTAAEVEQLRAGSALVAFLYAATNPDLVKRLAERNITAFSMDAVPRISRAQSMDALSSQASLAGYEAVILAAEHSDKIFPMMMTPAGTISRPRWTRPSLSSSVGLAALALALPLPLPLPGPAPDRKSTRLNSSHRT